MRSAPVIQMSLPIDLNAVAADPTNSTRTQVRSCRPESSKQNICSCEPPGIISPTFPMRLKVSFHRLANHRVSGTHSLSIGGPAHRQHGSYADRVTSLIIFDVLAR